MTAPKEEKPLSLQVDFSSSASIGDETSAVGISVSRNRLSPPVALQKFCGKRIGVRIRMSPADGEDPAQKHDPEDGYTIVEGHADVKKIGITPKDITFRLTFSNGEIDKHDLADFAAGSGTLTVNTVEDIPEDEETSEEEEIVERNGRPRGNQTGVDEGLNQELHILGKYERINNTAIGNLMDAVGGNTIANLEHCLRSHGPDCLKDFDGIGKRTAERIVKALEKFRNDFPMPVKSPTLFDERP